MIFVTAIKVRDYLLLDAKSGDEWKIVQVETPKYFRECTWSFGKFFLGLGLNKPAKGVSAILQFSEKRKKLGKRLHLKAKKKKIKQPNIYAS
jgi:hypothetical protein